MATSMSGKSFSPLPENNHKGRKSDASVHVMTDVYHLSKHLKGHLAGQVGKLFWQGRWENYSSRWENYFDRWGNYFGRWENYFGR